MAWLTGLMHHRRDSQQLPRSDAPRGASRHRSRRASTASPSGVKSPSGGKLSHRATSNASTTSTCSTATTEPCEAVSIPPRGSPTAAHFVVHSQRLGKGAYGAVLLGTDCEAAAQCRSAEVAVKMIPAGRMRPESLEREVSVLQRLTEVGPSILALRASLPPGSKAIRGEGGETPTDRKSVV